LTWAVISISRCVFAVVPSEALVGFAAILIRNGSRVQLVACRREFVSAREDHTLLSYRGHRNAFQAVSSERWPVTFSPRQAP
jgi:hypothetical protein